MSDSASGTTKPTPKTDTEWFALIAPEIDIDPADAEEPDVIEFAKQHAAQVVARSELSVDLDAIEWRATYELKAVHGRARRNSIKLSMRSLERNGWQNLMQTVRHELIHVWQHQHDHDCGHGDSFEQWMAQLNVKKRWGQVTPNWSLHCPECDRFLFEPNDELDAARRVHENNPFSPHCQTCDARVIQPLVKRDGIRYSREKLREVAVPSKAQEHIFLYNAESSKPSECHLEWNPETISLTNLPGIGAVTAEKIGDDISTIEDLLKDGELAPQVRDAVPKLHDDLLEAVQEHYADAQANRGPADLDKLERVMKTKSKWWKPIERIGEVGPVEALCRALWEDVSAGDRLTLEFHDIDTPFTATVVENRRGLGLVKLAIRFDRAVSEYGAEGHLRSQRSSYWSIPNVEFEDLDADVGKLCPDELVLTAINGPGDIAWQLNSGSHEGKL